MTAKKLKAFARVEKKIRIKNPWRSLSPFQHRHLPVSKEEHIGKKLLGFRNMQEKLENDFSAETIFGNTVCDFFIF